MVDWLYRHLSTSRRLVVSLTLRPLFPPGKDPSQHPLYRRQGGLQSRYRRCREHSWSYQDSNPYSSLFQPVAIPTHAIPAPFVLRTECCISLGSLSLVGTVEELLEKSSCSGLENRDYGRRGPVLLTTRHPSSRKSWH
jgi:hypothetical protein